MLEEIWEAVGKIPDPEIPVVSLVEMGIIRDIEVSEGKVAINITPTFSGCPALEVMKEAIEKETRRLGHKQVEVNIVLSPPWTTDWITEEARAKLKSFGLSPPRVHGGNIVPVLMDPVQCPYCDSENTVMKNQWGPTPCRMIFFCRSCQQPFEQFKPL